MTKRLEGKVVLVTGCGSSGPGWGNGKAMAVLFAREGAKVYGCDINLDAARETEAIVHNEGGTISVAQCDVTQPVAVETLIQDCIATYGDIDVLFRRSTSWPYRNCTPRSAQRRASVWVNTRASPLSSVLV